MLHTLMMLFYFLILGISILIFMSIKTWMFLSSSLYYKFSKSLLKGMMSKMSTHSSNSFLGYDLVLYSTFILIVWMNLWGMFPYLFSFSSRLDLTLSIGLTSWMMTVIKGFDKSDVNIPIHLVPKDLTVSISGFLTLIEFISNIIRPLTVSFRLSANVTAGHIIFGMFSSSLLFMLTSKFISLMVLPMIVVHLFYFVFEVCIMVIQTAVFTMLLYMYQNEYY